MHKQKHGQVQIDDETILGFNWSVKKLMATLVGACKAWFGSLAKLFCGSWLRARQEAESKTKSVVYVGPSNGSGPLL